MQKSLSLTYKLNLCDEPTFRVPSISCKNLNLLSARLISAMAVTTSFLANSSRLLAAIDLGTNSFKMVMVRAETNGKFCPIHRLKEHVRLGCETLSDGTIGSEAEQKAVLALQSFMAFLESQRAETRVVATSAIREAKNRDELLSRIEEKSGVEVIVLSGEEEARLIYFGVLQFLPVYHKTVLTVDIGGGSTEFVLGRQGKVLFSTSLNLGHIVLTEKFVRNGDLEQMRLHIQSVLRESGLVENSKQIKFEIAIGTSGTIKSIERAILLGYACDPLNSMFTITNFGVPRDWKFSREELDAIVSKLWSSDVHGDQAIRLGFSPKRAEFILAGSVLLLEIFKILKIEEMEISGYALGEGVIAETLARTGDHYEPDANIRWQSVTCCALRFNSKKRMRSAMHCATIAKDLFEGLKTSMFCLEAKDIEYLEAAILLHSIGLFVGKKGYHKHSYHIIKNGDHLHGYGVKEVELIALLARYHRKKFPGPEHSCIQSLPKEMQLKFRAICVIVRISLGLQQFQCMTFQGLDISHSHEGYKLFLRQVKIRLGFPDSKPPTSSTIKKELKLELEHFKEVFQQEMLIVVS